MSYDNGFRITYSFSSGLTNATLAAAAAINCPRHLGITCAAIEDISLSPSVAVVNTTLPMVLQIGTTATSGKYAAQNVGTTAGLALGTSYGTAQLDGRVAAYNPQATPSATNKGFIDLLNDGDVVGTFQSSLKIGTVAGTGTPAGTVTAHITIRWF